MAVVDAPTGTEWVDLASVAAAAAAFPGRAELLARFEREVLLPALGRLGAVLDPALELRGSLRELRAFLDLRQLPHLGPLFTRRALASVGWLPAGPAPWVARARLRASAALAALGPGAVRTERVAAWVAASLRLRDRALELPGRLLRQGVPPEAGEEVRALLRPTFRHMARDDHAERAALLCVVLAALDECRAGAAALVELVGSVWLYVTHFPCMSCLAVLGQFARHVPCPSLEASFDDAWRDD